MLLLASLFKTGHFDPIIIGIFGGVASALLARGAQSGAERSAREESARQLDESARAAANKAVDSARRVEELAARVEEMHTLQTSKQDK